MKRFINFIRDILYDLNYYIFTLLILAAICFILYNRIDYMFSTDYAAENTTTTSSNKTVEGTSVYSDDNIPEINITVIFPEGISVTDKARILYESGLIDDQEKFLNIVNTYNLEDKIGIGEFSIRKGSSLEEIINQISNNALSEISN